MKLKIIIGYKDKFLEYLEIIVTNKIYIHEVTNRV